MLESSRARQARPLHGLNSAGTRASASRVSSMTTASETSYRRHCVRALRRQTPFYAKVAFAPRLRVRRDHRDEQRALLQLLSDLRVHASPPTSSPDRTYFYAGRPERLADAPPPPRLRRVAEEDGFAGGSDMGSGQSGRCSCGTLSDWKNAPSPGEFIVPGQRRRCDRFWPVSKWNIMEVTRGENKPSRRIRTGHHLR